MKEEYYTNNEIQARFRATKVIRPHTGTFTAESFTEYQNWKNILRHFSTILRFPRKKTYFE